MIPTSSPWDEIQDWQWINGYFQMKEQAAAPSTPKSNYLRLYAKDTSGVSGLYYKNDAGTEIDLTGGITGTGANTRVAFWTGTTTLSSDADLTWDSTNNILTIPTTGIIRSGTLQGGTASGGNLTFSSTSNATKGNILFGSSAYDEVNDRLGIKNTSPRSALMLVETDADSGTSRGYLLDAYSGAAGSAVAARILFRAARNTVASPSAVQTNDFIGLMQAGGFNGSAFADFKSSFTMQAAENWSSTANGTFITFHTVPTGSTSGAERFRIGPSGQWGIGGAIFGSAGNYFRSGGSSAAPTWSTLVLPNTATINRIVYATSADTWGDNANLTFDGTDFALGSGIRARMQSQNRFRYLNTGASSSFNTRTQSLSNNTLTVMDLDGEDFDTDSVSDLVNNRLTANITGKYIVIGIIEYDGNATGSRLQRIRKNGVSEMVTSTWASVNTDVLQFPIMTILSLTATDYVELIGLQSSGGNLNSRAVVFTMMYIGE